MLNGSVLFGGVQSGVIVPPGSWSAALDSRFIVYASGIVRATNAWANGGAISWGLLDDADHTPSFFTSAAGVAGELVISFPPIKNILYGAIAPDETLNTYFTNCGVRIAFTSMRTIARSPTLLACNLQGTGVGLPTKSGSALGANLDFNAGTGLYRILESTQVANGLRGNYTVDQGFTVSYEGQNNYRIQRQLSGLGTYLCGFFLIDNATGLPVLTNMATTDRVVVNFGVTQTIINLNQYNVNNGLIADPLSNVWAYGIFEAWIVVFKNVPGSLLVYYQTNYPGATSYNIYRDVNNLFLNEVLVHEGNSGSFFDRGLTVGNTYYYRMKAVVGGVEQVVSYIWGQA